MASDTLIVERHGAVTELRLNREASGNAIDIETALEIAAAIDGFAADDTARVLVVTGSGERFFCSGGDLNELLDITNHAVVDRAGPLGFARLNPAKPTLAAVNGHCYGGGLELALWCDFRIASADAQFGALNRQWGLTLIDGGTQRLPEIVGYSNAMWMITTGCRIDAQRALEIGLVQEVVPTGQCRLRALEIAHSIAELPQPGLVADRNAAAASLETQLHIGLDIEAKLGRAVMRDPDVVERLTSYRQRHR